MKQIVPETENRLRCGNCLGQRSGRCHAEGFLHYGQRRSVSAQITMPYACVDETPKLYSLQTSSKELTSDIPMKMMSDIGPEIIQN